MSKRKLSLPALLASKPQKKGAQEEEPPKRIRVFPHVAGNWACHVQICFSNVSAANMATLRAVFAKGRAELCAARPEEMAGINWTFASEAEALHLSLTRTFVQHYRDLPLLFDGFDKTFCGEKGAFQVRMSRLDVFSNETGTNVFMGLRVASPVFRVRKLLGLASAFLGQRQLEAYAFSDESFVPHMTIASSAATPKLQSQLGKIKKAVKIIEITETRLIPEIHLQASAIVLKAGNKTCRVWL